MSSLRETAVSRCRAFAAEGSQPQIVKRRRQAGARRHGGEDAAVYLSLPNGRGALTGEEDDGDTIVPAPAALLPGAVACD
jgi:hypothetical protein